MSISCLSINDLPLNINNHYYAIVTTNSFERRLVYNYIGCYDTDNELFWQSEQNGNIPCMPFEDCKYSIRKNSYNIAAYGKYDVDYGNAVYFIFNGRRIVDIVTWYAINNVWNVEKFYTIQHFPDRFHCAEKNMHSLIKLFKMFNNLNPYNCILRGSDISNIIQNCYMRSDDADVENYIIPIEYNEDRECQRTNAFLNYFITYGVNIKIPATRYYHSFEDMINLHEYSVSEWINLIDKQRRKRMNAITCVTEDATSSALNMLNNVGIINGDYTKNGADKALNIEVIKERFPQTYSLDEIKETEKGKYAIRIYSRDEFDCIKQNYFYCDRILFTYMHNNDESWYPSYVIIDGRLIVDFCYTGKISSDYHIYAFEDVKSLKMKRVSPFNIKMPKGFGLKNFHVGSISSYPGYDDWIKDITYDTINYCMNDVVNTTENYKYWEVIRMLYNKIIDVIIESDMRTETETMIDKSCNDVKHITTATPIKRTIIKWADGSTTSVECPEKDYNPYYGFAIAVAKYAMGNDNTMSNEADKWLNKIPKQRAEEQRKKDREKAIREQREAKNAERREHRRMKKLTMDRVRAYEKYQEEQKIREEAEKFGVPKDFEPDKT